MVPPELGSLPEIVDCESAESFIHELAPTNTRWSYRESPWIYRGQADAVWRLIPTAFRENAFGPWNLLAGFATIQMGDWAEARVLREFELAADRAGLTIPEDSQLRRDINEPADEHNALEPGASFVWPRKWRLSALALAQHYGLPTRLLDWSWNPRVAAYFAAYPVAVALRKKSPQTFDSDRLAVWALNTGAIRPGELIKGPNPEAEISVVTAPYASNPNLQAQEGVFTVDRTRPHVPPFEEAVKHFAPQAFEHGWCPARPFVKLTLAHAQAHRLLEMLSWEGIHPGRLFPGYGGAAAMVKDFHLFPSKHAPKKGA